MSVAEHVFAAGSLHLEAEFLIKPDRRLVIDINGQFEPLQVKPIIGRIGKCG